MRNIHREVLTETQQTSETRRHLIEDAEKTLGGRTLVAFFTSFVSQESISDQDCDMLQSLLLSTDCSKGIALMISSPGGDGLAAERIVNTLRAHSGTGDYWAIVPGKAKSAGTVVTMGASNILMGPSSELGPVDPQIFKLENGVRKTFSAHNLVTGYDRLIKLANETDGHIEPFLQQLSNYDDREITWFRSLMELSKSIAIKVLRAGMMSDLSEAEIEKKIQVFLDPEAGTLAHGRPIFAEEAADCGLKVEPIDIKSDSWAAIYELYVRLDRFVSGFACKAVETRDEAFFVSNQ